MTELKTLKEIATETEMVNYFEDIKEFDIKRITRVVKGRTKQEAIKWIKDLQKGFNYLNDPNETTQNYFAIIRWIKHFFNLTEEDLQ